MNFPPWPQPWSPPSTSNHYLTAQVTSIMQQAHLLSSQVSSILAQLAQLQQQLLAQSIQCEGNPAHHYRYPEKGYDASSMEPRAHPVPYVSLHVGPLLDAYTKEAHMTYIRTTLAATDDHLKKSNIDKKRDGFHALLWFDTEEHAAQALARLESQLPANWAPLDAEHKSSGSPAHNDHEENQQEGPAPASTAGQYSQLYSQLYIGSLPAADKSKEQYEDELRATLINFEGNIKRFHVGTSTTNSAIMYSIISFDTLDSATHALALLTAEEYDAQWAKPSRTPASSSSAPKWVTRPTSTAGTSPTELTEPAAPEA